MTKNPLLLGTAVGLVLAIAACDSSTGPSQSAISQADANQLAADLDDVSANAFGGFVVGPSFSVVPAPGSTNEISVPIPIDRQFTITNACPKGGEVTIAGRTTGTADRATGTLSIETNATRTDAACAFETRAGSIITINGNPNIAYHSTFNFVAWKPSGLQTQTHKGSFTWSRSTGGSGTCDVDLTSVFDPSTHTVTVTGTFCGRTVNVTRTRGG
jgi:hypothetical protein